MMFFHSQLMLEIRRQEQLDKMKGKEIVQAISMAVAATRWNISIETIENWSKANQLNLWNKIQNPESLERRYCQEESKKDERWGTCLYWNGNLYV